MANKTLGASPDSACTPRGTASSSSTPGYRPASSWMGPLLRAFALCGAHAVHATSHVAHAGAAVSSDQTPKRTKESRMWMTVGERRFAITLADTEAARAFAAMLPLTLDMEDLNGNEKKKELPKALPTDTYRPGTIRNGDILLWGSHTVVVFYLTFDSPYPYTRLGRLDDPAGLAQALGPRNVRVVFSRN